MPTPVFQIDPPVLDSYHRADVSALHVLDHQAEFGGVLGRARLAPAHGKDIGSIAINHAAILESLAAKHRYGTPA
ncbi:hypothetical protein MSEO_17090 [Mycobacterium seoulense]|uniref:Uncharacterized protein n=1 Tax=Mycobacterium seoulense TaxID=386911 RepID=A0A7I7NYA1_9MYCO|nr:hypothetical protein MSEO_17090 [Mycobacterium seoulense]